MYTINEIIVPYLNVKITNPRYNFKESRLEIFQLYDALTLSLALISIRQIKSHIDH